MLVPKNEPSNLRVVVNTYALPTDVKTVTAAFEHAFKTTTVVPVSAWSRCSSAWCNEISWVTSHSLTLSPCCRFLHLH
jgi:hypothetical protein